MGVWSNSWNKLKHRRKHEQRNKIPGTQRYVRQCMTPTKEQRKNNKLISHDLKGFHFSQFKKKQPKDIFSKICHLPSENFEIF